MELVGVFSFFFFSFLESQKKRWMDEGIDLFSCISLGLRKKVR